MSDLIRVAAGEINPFTFVTTSSYLIVNWVRQTDMRAGDQWLATQPTTGALQTHESGLEVGSGGWYGKYNSLIEFFVLTPNMRTYLETTILGGNGIAVVTALLHSPRHDLMQVFYGELLSPYAANSELEATRVDDTWYANNQYLLRRGSLQALNILSSNGSDVLVTHNNEWIAL